MTQLTTYVDGRLVRWGAWYHATQRPGPKEVRSQMAAILARAGDTDGGRRVNFDPSECEETDRAVLRLFHSDRDLYAVVIESYIKGGTIEQKFKALHLTRATYYRHLDGARAKVLDYLLDEESAAELQRARWAANMPVKIRLTA